MIRITGGRFKGRKLLVPGGQRVRPTSDRVRESIFSVVGDMVQGARVLDVFAGTGALGLEALSRGAGQVIFLERDPRVFSILRQNISLCGVEDVSEAYCTDWLKGVKKLSERGLRFDLVFADPPYEMHVEGVFLENVRQLTHGQSLVVFEHSAKKPLEFNEAGWNLIRIKRYGETAVDFLRPL